MAFITSFHQPFLMGTFSSSSSVSSGLPASIVDLQQQLLLSDPSISSSSWLSTAIPVMSSSPVSFLFTSSSFGDFLSPLVLSCIAGASTSLGAMVVFLIPSRSVTSAKAAAADDDDDKQSQFLEQFLSFSLSLAASVMITVSIISILPEALEGTIELSTKPEYHGFTILSQQKLLERVLGFGVGCLAYFLLSRVLLILPEPESILETKTEETNISLSPSGSIMTASLDEELLEAERIQRSSSWRMAMLIFISLLLHNAPEGLAVAASASESHELGLIVTIGIMMHNIPEGLAIAVPCLLARPDKPWLAFGLASISGLAEPMGALVALQLLHSGSNGDTTTATSLALGNLLAAVAGIMCMVSIRDLYPEAQRHLLPSPEGTTTTKYSATAPNSSKDYSTIWMGTVCGMSIMTATEFLLVPR